MRDATRVTSSERALREERNLREQYVSTTSAASLQHRDMIPPGTRTSRKRASLASSQRVTLATPLETASGQQQQQRRELESSPMMRMITPTCTGLISTKSTTTQKRTSATAATISAPALRAPASSTVTTAVSAMQLPGYLRTSTAAALLRAPPPLSTASAAPRQRLAVPITSPSQSGLYHSTGLPTTSAVARSRASPNPLATTSTATAHPKTSAPFSSAAHLQPSVQRAATRMRALPVAAAAASTLAIPVVTSTQRVSTASGPSSMLRAATRIRTPLVIRTTPSTSTAQLRASAEVSAVRYCRPTTLRESAAVTRIRAPPPTVASSSAQGVSTVKRFRTSLLPIPTSRLSTQQASISHHSAESRALHVHSSNLRVSILRVDQPTAFFEEPAIHNNSIENFEIENNVRMSESEGEDLVDEERMDEYENEPFRNRINEMNYDYEREERNEQREPTRLESGNHSQSNEDFSNRFMNILENTLSVIRNSSSNNDSSSTSRKNYAKTLSSFSGDPLDWVRFKEAFEHSSEYGNFSDRENVTRLYDCLRGEARSAARILFAGGNSAADIMKTLEMRFGNPKVIVSKLLNEIRYLLRIESLKMSFIEFATNLKNTINALKAFKGSGYLYLYNPDLLSEVLRKLPSSMMSNYVRFVSTSSSDKPDLEKLSDFIFQEAEMSLAAGVIETRYRESSRYKSERASRSNRNSSHPVCTLQSEIDTHASEHDRDKSKNRSCAHCNRGNHSLDKCRDFLKGYVVQRWKIVRAANLCFKCLRGGHRRPECNGSLCRFCKNSHHELLHDNRSDRKPHASSNSTRDERANDVALGRNNNENPQS